MSSLTVSETYKGTTINFSVKKCLFSEMSDYQLVEILETHDWGRIMLLDGLMMVTELDEFFYHETITHLPMSLFSKCERVLVVGGGDGGTVRELVKYPNIKEILMVEIDELVVNASKQFLPSLSSGLDDPRVKLHFEDASLFIKNAPVNHYDLIISDSSDPVGFAASLIQTDFFEMIKKALTPEGIFIAQSGSALLQREEVKQTWNNLNQVFCNTELAWALTPTYPGSWWTYVLASKNSFAIKNDLTPTNLKTRFWKPAMTAGQLCKPGFIEEIIKSKVEAK
jgi:spermidine synthase